MAENIKLVVYPAKDLDASKKVFQAFLGVEPYADSPYYVGYQADNLEVGLDSHGQDVIVYLEVEDIHESLQPLLDAGAIIHQDIKDVGGGMLIAQVKDGSGNVVGLRQLPTEQF